MAACSRQQKRLETLFICNENNLNNLQIVVFTVRHINFENCTSLGTVRENYCCRESFNIDTKFAKNIVDAMEKAQIPCVSLIPEIEKLLENETV